VHQWPFFIQMKKLICDYCFEDHFFDEEKDRPEICKNCNTPLQHIKTIDATTTDGDPHFSVFENFGLSKGIVLTYQKTGDLIEIPHNEIIILGRENTGKEVLENIPHISREHCKIEFINGHYLVTDLNSMNGTFIGPSRRDCLKHKGQELKNNDLLYLGREPFLATIFNDASSNEDLIALTDVDDELPSLRYKCKGCGKVHDMNLIICDECGSYGQIEPLDE